MAKSDPAYVRLVDRMARGCQVDIDSGFSLAGLDVKEFPADEYPLAQKYVRDAIRRGTIEGCSKAEFEEVNSLDHDYLAQIGVTVKPLEVEGHIQESRLVALADQNRHQIESARGLGSSGNSYKNEQVRKAAILAQQRGSVATSEQGDGDNGDGKTE